jgi:starvation-inducible outer membrane lipoprotein
VKYFLLCLLLSACASAPEQKPVPILGEEEVRTKAICYDGRFTGVILYVPHAGVIQVEFPEDDPCAGGI